MDSTETTPAPRPLLGIWGIDNARPTENLALGTSVAGIGLGLVAISGVSLLNRSSAEARAFLQEQITALQGRVTALEAEVQRLDAEVRQFFSELVVTERSAEMLAYAEAIRAGLSGDVEQIRRIAGMVPVTYRKLVTYLLNNPKWITDEVMLLIVDWHNQIIVMQRTVDIVLGEKTTPDTPSETTIGIARALGREAQERLIETRVQPWSSRIFSIPADGEGSPASSVQDFGYYDLNGAQITVATASGTSFPAGGLAPGFAASVRAARAEAEAAMLAYRRTSLDTLRASSESDMDALLHLENRLAEREVPALIEFL